MVPCVHVLGINFITLRLLGPQKLREASLAILAAALGIHSLTIVHISCLIQITHSLVLHQYLLVLSVLLSPILLNSHGHLSTR